MAQRREIITVYAAGVVQGVGLVTFPAASTVFTSPAQYGLTSTEYGGMFLPQAILAIVASLLAASLQSRLGSKRIYLLGLLANLLSMSLLVASWFALSEHALAYGILLVATTCTGIGFGFTVPALNTLVAAFFPKNLDNAVLGLNALLGLGTALAPVFVAIFVGLGIWWGLPVLVGLLLLGLLFLSLSESLNEGELSHTGQPQKGAFPMRFWIFAAFVLLYGVCETMNGNWASLYLTKHFGASTAMASLALTMFWSMVTVGRVLFAVLEKWASRAIGCPRPAVPGVGRLHAQCFRAENQFVVWHPGLCPGRARLFGAFAPCDQFWPEATHDHRRLSGRWTDRFLSDWLRSRCLRGRPFANLGRIGFERHLRRRRHSCACDGRAILCHHG